MAPSSNGPDPYLAGVNEDANGSHNATDFNSNPQQTTKMETHPTSSEWHQPGPNAYDFHSDTITTPTLSMLQAITKCTLTDDIYRGDPTTAALENHLATLSGHEAGLLVMSGTMGNQVSVRSHLTTPPHTVLCDARSHIANYEAGGISTLSGAQLVTVWPANNHHLTLSDITKHVVTSDDVHAAPTRVISLENTLAGMIMPLSEVQRIRDFAHEHNIILHLDGARIWEAVAAKAGSLTEYCSLFDSVSLCFSKGLGAPIGSMLVGSSAFIKQAKRIRKMMGGSTRQSGIIAAAARVAVDEGFGSGPNGEGGKLRDCHAKARRIGKLWEDKGGKLTWPVETNMVWLDLESAGVSNTEFAGVAREEEEALMALERTMERVLAKK
ncbi:hypothetical protein LTR70_005085 [Exophiala xenobiotica]|uniref:Aromatic amino acid beta-eliminating lyase/threonine aldolase domain-containing protein n=1 Tax=Lithohypha guttulata TaxID=1690604 RepID=A0ABR0K8P4_9EURO|nr:hypothetical protein LTR24_005561 [Lithohypha guttulata]KAK5319332.1 hypothetical protein LTR70_005085 [Exophiala xenobiotica]